MLKKLIQRVKDIIELTPGAPNRKAEFALEITAENVTHVIELGIPKEYANPGDFIVMFSDEYMTVAPCAEFHKHYWFKYGFERGPELFTPIGTNKKL